MKQILMSYVSNIMGHGIKPFSTKFSIQGEMSFVAFVTFVTQVEMSKIFWIFFAQHDVTWTSLLHVFK